MSIISRTGDLFYAYRFLKLLVTPWEKTKAYELGILDGDGKLLKKARELQTSEEKSAYTVFHRLVFNIKRLLNKLPFGKSKLASWATALFLIKEETNMSEKDILKIMKKMEVEFDDTLFESTWYMTQDKKLQPGIYSLVSDTLSPITGEVIAPAKSKIKVDEDCHAIGTILDTPIYEVYHIQSKQKIYVNPGELIR